MPHPQHLVQPPWVGWPSFLWQGWLSSFSAIQSLLTKLRLNQSFWGWCSWVCQAQLRSRVDMVLPQMTSWGGNPRKVGEEQWCV